MKSAGIAFVLGGALVLAALTREAARAVNVDVLARTLWGEARSEGVIGMRAVAAVIMNRAADSRWPDALADVALQAWQFSAWNANDPNRDRMLRVTEADPQFRLALDIAREAVEGRLVDPTGGANHYFADYIARPSWARTMTETTRIGRHIFMKG